MSDEKTSVVRGLAKGGAILFVGSFFSRFIMYLYRLFVARELGSASYGLLSIGLAVFWISLSLSHLGVTGGIQRKVSEYIGKEEEERIPDVIWAAITSTMPLSLLAAVILFVSADFIAGTFFNKPEAASMIRIFSIALPFQMMYKNSASVIKAFREMRYITYTDKLFKSLVTLGVTVGLVLSGYGLLGAVVGQLAGIILSSLLMLYFAQNRVYPFLTKKTQNLGAEREELLRYSLPLFFSGIVGLSMSWADTVLLGVLDTASEVGVYNAAFPTAQSLRIFAMGISTTLFPTVSELYAKGKKQESVELASTSLKWIFTVTFPGLVLMVLFSNPILRLLFGKEYTGGAIALSVLGTAYFLQTMTSYAGTYIKSEDWTKLSFYNSIVISVLNLVLNFALIPMYGNTGAALATAFSMTLGSMVSVIEAYYFFGVNPYSIRRYIPPFLSAVFSVAIVYSGSHYIYETIPPLVLFPALAVFGGLYGFFFLVLGGLEEDDIMVLKELDEKTDIDLEPVKEIIRRLAR